MFDRHTIGCDRARRQVRFRAWDSAWADGFPLSGTVLLRCGRRFRFMEAELLRRYSTGLRSCRLHPYLYGAEWTNTYAGAPAGGDGRLERREEDLCERGIFSCRPWILLRRTAAYEPHSARQAWALTLEFLRS